MRQIKKIVEEKGELDLKLVGKDGNAFAIMSRFRREARKKGWTQSEIDVVINESKSGDYDHLLQTFMACGGH